MVRHELKETADVIEETTAEPKCPHHWLIEPATGATSMGLCKLCGAQKEFSNQFKRSSLIAPDFTRLSTTSAKDNGDTETPAQSAEIPVHSAETPVQSAEIPV